VANNPFYFKENNLRRKFGLSLAEWYKMCHEANWRCEVCGDVLLSWSAVNVDHDHTKIKGDPGFVRGILCGHCNRGLGQIKDNLGRARAMVSYLEKAACRSS
jgi:hypothetical protein